MQPIGGDDRPVSVRYLLDLASAEVDKLSRELSRGTGPDPLTVADQWPAMRRASAHLIASVQGLSSRREGMDRAYGQTSRLERTLTTLSAASDAAVGSAQASQPFPAAVEDPDANGIARAARALGAAGDLLRSTNGSHLTRADLEAAATAASALITVAAQVTAHATLHDLRTLKTAHEATTVAAAAGEVIASSNQAPVRGSLDVVAAKSRPQPRSGDLARSLEVATWDWRTAALVAADRAVPSSRDLRATLTVSSHILGVATLALQAGSRAHQRQLAAADDPEADEVLTRIRGSDQRLARKLREGMIDFTSAASVWRGHATGAPATPELLTATSLMTNVVSMVARDGARWLSPDEVPERCDPVALVLAARGSIDAVHEVTEVHHDVVEELLRRGHIHIAVRRLPRVSTHPGWEDLPPRIQEAMAAERMDQVRAGAWIPIEWEKHSAALMEAYDPLVALTTTARTGYWANTAHWDQPSWPVALERISERGSRTQGRPDRVEGQRVEPSTHPPASEAPTSNSSDGARVRVGKLAQAYTPPLTTGATREAVRRGLEEDQNGRSALPNTPPAPKRTTSR